MFFSWSIQNNFVPLQKKDMEEWKQITFAPKYEVSNMGRIRNISTKRVLAYCNGKDKSHNQYTVFLVCNSICGSVHHIVSQREQHTVSQIVYNHWCLKDGERPSYYSKNYYKVGGNRIGHKDGNKANNRADNLFRY